MNPDATADRWYRVDADDRIVEVDPDWDQFAEANGGHTATSAHVLGQPLSDFLSGDVTRMFLAAALEATRLTGLPRTLAYRCDAPGMRRSLEMTVQPLPEGEVLVQHRLLSATPKASATTFRYGQPPRAAWYRCSQCLRLRAANAATAWQPPEQLDLPPAARSVVVADTVCADCLHAAATVAAP
ncbi:hypothetical protein [Roseateles sp. BYS87W]|uniref:Uncharacterized protein n=1 Tax=Pelomonas baiyunensis TaxID=3299026 RepID=A0ABW7GUR2_9BURK